MCSSLIRRLRGKWPLVAISFSTALLSHIALGQTTLATIQAESYNFMSGVQTEATSDTGGGLNVGWIDASDWMAYSNTTVSIPTAGAYDVEYRVASLGGGGSIRLEEAGGS